MTYVSGVYCDNCQGLDLADIGPNPTENYFPRNGWASISFWSPVEEGKYASPSGDDFHVCSVKCLEELAKKLQQSIDQPEDVQPEEG